MAAAAAMGRRVITQGGSRHSTSPQMRGPGPQTPHNKAGGNYLAPVGGDSSPPAHCSRTPRPCRGRGGLGRRVHSHLPGPGGGQGRASRDSPWVVPPRSLGKVGGGLGPPSARPAREAAPSSPPGLAWGGLPGAGLGSEQGRRPRPTKGLRKFAWSWGSQRPIYEPTFSSYGHTTGN